MTTIMTNFSEEELKICIKDTVKEALREFSNFHNDPSSDNLLSISEASKYTHLAKQTLYGLTSRREIPFIKKGKKLYFKRMELEAWIMEGRKLTKHEIN
jgi:excisionase family DNA binding protein